MKSINSGTCIIILTIIGGFNLSWSQNPNLYFRNLSINDGLPSPEVYSVHQDRSGNMWFGTDNGASRFDGYYFQTFDANRGLPYNVVLDIIGDQSGQVWFGTLNCQAAIYRNGKIEEFPYNLEVSKVQDQFVDGSLLYIDSEKTAYFKLTNCGFLKVDTLGQSELIRASDPGNIFIFKRENFCAASASSCYQYQTPADKKEYTYEFYENGERYYYQVQKNTSHSGHLTAHAIDADHVVLSYNSQLLYGSTSRVEWIIPSNFTINDLANDNEGGLWLGLSNNLGLRHFRTIKDLKENRFNQYLIGENITGVTIDRDGGIWASSHESGVFYCPARDLKIYDRTYGFPSNNISSIAFKSEHELFVGFANREVVEVDFDSNKLMPIRSNNSGSYSSVLDLFYFEDGDILFTDDSYVTDQKFYGYLSSNQGVVKFGAKKYHYDHSRNLLWTLPGRAFWSIDPTYPKINFMSTEVKLHKRIFSLYVDSLGTIWTGTNEGLAEFRDNLLIPVNIDHPAFHNRIEDIDAFDRKHLIFGTKGRGIIIWKDEEIIEISTDNGLASNMVEDVHVDENNVAWVSTFNGLSRITLNENVPAVRTFRIDNGLPTNEIYQVKSFGGQPWICTAGGLIKWENPAFDSISYKPNINSVLVNGIARSPDNLTMNHQENNLSIRYLTTSFKQFGKIDYRYRLNQNDSWAYTNDLVVNYAKLSPGKYRFEVQSENCDGIWSESSISPFVINSAWYNTWWFRSLAILSFGLGIISLYSFRNRRRTEKLKIKSEMENLKRSALHAQMNPHFIFNCLNSIQTYVNLKQDVDANYYLINFSNLIRGCLDASLDDKIPLAKDIQFITNYLELEKMRFSPKFTYTIDIADHLDINRIFISPMLVLPLVENAVVHGITCIDRHGEIALKYQMQGEHLEVTVLDNGPGITNHLDLKKSQSMHRSVGITITRKRLELIDHQKKNNIDMQDIVNDEGEILGTLVKIRIKTSTGNSR